MEIEPSRSSVPISRLEARPVRRAEPAPGDAGEFTETEALRQAMASTPEVRADVVERARSLANNPNYPPEEIVRKLSQLFAAEFHAPDSPARSA